MKGWVYVISNKAMKGLIKVGHSTKDPELRAQELDHTGSPHPYMVEYEMLIQEPYRVEQAVHKVLSKFHEGKEWFRCTPEQAVAAIKQVAGDKQILENFKLADRERAIALRRQEEAAKQARKMEEEEQQKRKTEIEQQRKQIYDQYELLLKAVRPNKFLYYFFSLTIFLCVFVSLFYILPLQSRILGYLILAIAVITFVSINSFLENKYLESPEYKALIEERDRKIAALENTVKIRQSD